MNIETDHGPRRRILEAASKLIAENGPDSATTRAVALIADVQAPAIYRIFGDKRGLLDAVTEHAIANYVAKKSAAILDPDPVQDLRNGWDVHVGFGLQHPDLFRLMSAGPADRTPSPAITAGAQLLRKRVNRIAKAGRLIVSEERAVSMLHSSCIGVVLTLIGQPSEHRDMGLIDTARDAVFYAITGAEEPVAPTIKSASIMLRGSLGGIDGLSMGETFLMAELLDRIADKT